jgi:hypothetical protein
MSPTEYYNKQPSPQKEICLKLREIILACYPDAIESMLWGVPAFNNGMFYIVTLKDHVNLGFTVAGLTKEEASLFEGGGKTTRKIEIKAEKDIDEMKMRKLLNLVYQKSI